MYAQRNSSAAFALLLSIGFEFVCAVFCRFIVNSVQQADMTDEQAPQIWYLILISLKNLQ